MSDGQQEHEFQAQQLHEQFQQLPPEAMQRLVAPTATPAVRFGHEGARASGPIPMYASQLPAVTVAYQFTPVRSDSTPDAPPTVSDVDLYKLAQEKRRLVIDQLPRMCTCGAPFDLASTRTFNEMKDGTCMAYCTGKKPDGSDGCCHSQMLFSLPDLRIPQYKKVCIYTPNADERRALYDAECAAGRMAAAHLAMLGAKCETCGLDGNHHKLENVDKNGWWIAGYKVLTLPPEFPKFNVATRRWE